MNRGGGAAAPARTAAFCPSLWMTQRHIKGGEMGQNGSQCGCTGVKHDQTGGLNGVIIVPKKPREGGGGRKRQSGIALISCHPLAPQCGLCPSRYRRSSVRCIVWMYERLLVSHVLRGPEEKPKDLCVPKRKLLTRPALRLNQQLGFTLSWTHTPASRDTRCYGRLCASVAELEPQCCRAGEKL